MPERVLVNCEQIYSIEYGLIGVDAEGNDVFKQQASFHQAPYDRNTLMGLKKNSKNTQWLECRNTKCGFSIAHNIEPDETGIRRMFVSSNKFYSFGHEGNDCYHIADEKMTEIQKWLHSDALARQYTTWLIANPKEKRNFKSFLMKLENWNGKTDIFNNETPAWGTILAVLNKYIRQQVIENSITEKIYK